MMVDPDSKIATRNQWISKVGLRHIWLETPFEQRM